MNLTSNRISTLMLIPRLAVVGLLVLGTDVACGQDYPTRTLRIVTSAPTTTDRQSAYPHRPFMTS